MEKKMSIEVETFTLMSPFDFSELEKVKFVSHDEGPDYMINFSTLSEREFSFIENVPQNN